MHRIVDTTLFQILHEFSSHMDTFISVYVCHSIHTVFEKRTKIEFYIFKLVILFLTF